MKLGCWGEAKVDEFIKDFLKKYVYARQWLQQGRLGWNRSTRRIRMLAYSAYVWYDQRRHFNFSGGGKFFFIFQCHRTIEKLEKNTLYM